eukprot:UN00012
MLFRWGIIYCTYCVFKMQKLIKIEKKYKSLENPPLQVYLISRNKTPLSKSPTRPKKGGGNPPFFNTYFLSFPTEK